MSNDNSTWLKHFYWNLRSTVRSRDKWRWTLLFADLIGARQPHPIDNILAKAQNIISRQNIPVVLDVGANVGQFGGSLRHSGFRGRIVSFEPLPAEHGKLMELTASDDLWEVFDRCALGARVGETTINIAGNSYSSSLLDMLPAHVNAAPDSAYQGSVATKIFTLDSIAERINPERRKLFLKIDTQGFELEVLRGAIETLPDVQAIQLELSLCRLYKDQPLYNELITYLEERGFTIWSIFPGFEDKSNGQLLQFDAIFCRP
jgi:FkbM family methyltransferase